MRQTVGNIQGYDVIYIPEKRILYGPIAQLVSSI